MASIYEISSDYLALQELAQDPEIDEQMIIDTMEALDGELEFKADQYARIIRNLTAEMEGFKAEIDRLTSKKRAIDNNIKRMKMALQGAMEIANRPKFKTDLFSFNIQNNSPSVIIDVPVDSIPMEYIKLKDTNIDKTKIKLAINSGEDLSSIAHLETSQSLRIK